ncbi:hypothetical protein F5884DRAFT_855590 [Xylogone sp. PMI_703]|nr:hypothetical protein F5884DRAFT_855590 [Xylogone sp. PMI_703]
MRLGTRSCTECRRRKVRCIFNPGDKTCKECILHAARCIPQQHSQSKKHPEKTVNVKQRLDDLEGMVLRLCEAVESNPSSDLSRVKSSVEDIFRRFHSQSTSPQDTISTSDTSKHDCSPADVDVCDTPYCSDDGLDDIPLLGLFREAMYIQKSDGQVHGNHLDTSSERRMNYIIKVMKNSLPAVDDLWSILRVTQRYWPCWHDSYNDLFPQSISNDKVSAAGQYILDSLQSSIPVNAAKALLFLGLCVQQLPLEHRQLYLRNLPGSANDLIDRYYDSAEALLSLDERIKGSIEGLEAIELQMRITMNMGKPRKAMFRARSALNFAIFQGLHRPQNYTDTRKRKMWAHIWQAERFVSMTLGIPSSTSDSYPGLSKRYVLNSVAAKFTHDIAVMAGHVNERNLNHDSVESFHSATLRIDQEIQASLADLPPGFLDSQPTPDMPLEEIYSFQSLKLYYWNLVKSVHYPYIFKPVLDQVCEYNRQTGLDACRKLIEVYRTLRIVSGKEIIVCDLMDYEAFSAALVIVIHLFSQRYTLDPQLAAQDWALVHDMIATERRVTSVMECKVATQAIRVLEYLSAVYHGTYTGPETFETMIPYFGKVRIKQFSSLAPTGSSNLLGAECVSDSPASGDFQLVDMPPFSQSVEFGTNIYTGLNSDDSIAAFYLSDQELGVDWTNVLEIDGTYEWNQLYNNMGVK